ncbi:L-asparaginase II [Hyaloraphidium curvatum]|nr:L-asparaginase II [Hyaloraphidium curvatum]
MLDPRRVSPGRVPKGLAASRHRHESNRSVLDYPRMPGSRDASPPAGRLRVDSLRAGLVESAHDVTVAVVDASGRLIASSNDPSLKTFWRSSCKFFQAMPMVEAGAADRFGLSQAALALACASHSSEREHLEVCDEMLAACGCRDSDLACGPHVPLAPDVAEKVAGEGINLTPRWSNCSGKHAAMLAYCRHVGWPVEGYELPDHPLQQRLLDEVAEWTSIPRDELPIGVDGCALPTYFLPVRAMALAYARFGASSLPQAVRLRNAVAAHPLMIAGRNRLCTDLAAASKGAVLAKIGAEGLYGATIPSAGLGIALKINDGDFRCAPVALVAVLKALADRGTVDGLAEIVAHPEVAKYAEIPLPNTRGFAAGALLSSGTLRFES